MKKVMTIACLFMAGMVMGATPTAQVYDVVLKVKTTAAASATLNNKQNPVAVGADEGSCPVTYRKQSTATWKGLIWGCGCETINGTWEKVVNECEDIDVKQLDTVKGCILWDDKTKVPVYIGDGSDLTDVSTVPGTGFGWQLLHAINKDGKQVEGTWTMTQRGNACDENGILFDFVGSGFGTGNVVVENGEPTCLSYIKTMSGNFAGYMKAPAKYNTTEWTGCTYCGFSGGETTCDFAEAWQWCDWDYTCACDTDIEENLDLTSAYGTWTIKYNSTLSKKMAQPLKVTSKGVKGMVISIRDVYDFKKLPYVEAAIEAVENKIWGVQTECEELGDEVLEAKADVNAAKANVESVSTAKLAADVDNAKDNLYLANSNLLVKSAAFTQAKYEYADATNEYNKVSNTLATASWKIDYINSSSKSTSKSGTGLDAFEDAVDELEHFTVNRYEFNDRGIHPTTYAKAKEYVSGKRANLAGLKNTADDKFSAYELAEAELKAAEYVKELCEKNLDAAKLRYADRGNLQYLANQELLYAQLRLNKAEDAYESAGCN